MGATQSKRRTGILALLLVASGCANAPAASYRTPDHWSKAEAYGAKPSHAYLAPPEHHSPQSDGNEQAPKRAKQLQGFAHSQPRIRPPTPQNTPRLRGSACLSALSDRGVAFGQLNQLKGVETPVEIRGQLGGVEYYAVDGRSLQLDCRLALALERVGPLMREHGVRRIRFSGAYVYRTTRTGRLSHHAHGLAIDLHDFDTTREALTVKGDFKKNIGCHPGAPLLNALSCSLRAEALFDEFLTPDYNADHYDHLHISVPRKKKLPSL